MSKGSSPRPVDKDKFESNYDKIFGSKPPVYQRKQLQDDIEQSKEQDNEEHRQ
jgi:hypothetical protein